MHILKRFRRLKPLVAAALFAATTSTAVFIADATHAGQPSQGLFASAPQPAGAAGIGIRVGSPYRYYRYANRGGVWVRFGFGYAPAPGYVGGYYLGYAPPPVAYYPYGYYYGARYCPLYYGRRYYHRPYYGHRYHRYSSYGWRRY